MDTGSIVRPAGRTPQSRTKSAARGAVPASLSAPQSVTAVAKSTEVPAEDHSHVPTTAIDAQSREAISQALDAARQLVPQPPEDVKQRLRAYARRATARREQSGKGLDLEV